MGFRFRKTISLGKGVRLNVSKSGVSTSVGPRGASVTFGKNGTYANLGIPGTGLSYRTKIGGPNGKSGKQARTAGQTALANIANYTGNPDFTFSTAISDSGEIAFLDADGNEIKDSRLISLLKKHPQYLENKSSLEADALERSREFADELQRVTEGFLTIHSLSPRIKTESDFKRHRAELAPKEYIDEPFQCNAPEKEAIRDTLKQVAENVVTTKMPWKRQKEINAYVSSRLEIEYQNAMQDWQNKRRRHQSEQLVKKQAFDKMAQERYAKSLRKMDAALSGNESYIEWAVERWMGKCALPVEIDGSFDYDPLSKRLMVDLDLPEIEDLPETHAVQMASGAYKEKNKSQKQLREEYANCVMGLMVYVSANLFNVSPAISEVVISGFTTGRDNAGAVADQCIVSVRFERAPFSTCGYSSSDPMETILKFENRLNVTKTKIFKPVQPL